MRMLYRLTKVLIKERSRNSAAILDKRDNLVSEKMEILSRCTEYFKEVLNREKPTYPITTEDEYMFKPT